VLALPPTTPTAITPPLPNEPDFATKEEEWEVAKQSAWNWLVDKLIASAPGLVSEQLSDWRFVEPPENATQGRQYELRQSYEAMQNFLSVCEFAMGFVTPLIVESALANGLPSRFQSFMREFHADTGGAVDHKISTMLAPLSSRSLAPKPPLRRSGISSCTRKLGLPNV
jgi:hypothetical protein